MILQVVLWSVRLTIYILIMVLNFLMIQVKRSRKVKIKEIEKKIKDLESPSLPAKKLQNKVKYIDGVACYLSLINQNKSVL